MFNIFWNNKSPKTNPDDPGIKKCIEYTVSIAESVSAGALSNSFCTKQDSSNYFKGGIVTYSLQSKKELLDIQCIDLNLADQINYANEQVTKQMAMTVCKKFNSRIGIAATGFSLPFKKGQLEIIQPYAHICLYDSILDVYVMRYLTFAHDPYKSATIQRAAIQASIGLNGRKLYLDYIDRETSEFILV